MTSQELPYACRRIAGLGLLMALAWHLPLPRPCQSLLMTAAAMAQLYLPILRAEKMRWPLTILGLSSHNAGRSLGFALVLALGILPLWVACTQLWFGLFGAHSPAFGASHPLRWSWLLAFFNQLGGIALPEEVFWRGYVQTVLGEAYPRRRRALFNLTDGALVANLLFAGLHLVAQGDPMRLATFLPGLLFAWQRERFGSIFGAVLLHALFNTTAAWALGDAV